MERMLEQANHMLKVMLIEDDPGMVSLLTTLLNMEGFKVEVPVNHHIDGLLRTMVDERPQIALVDVNLATGSGLDLVRQIRNKPEFNATRILMASGSNVKQECILAGADGFILKPFMPDELIKLIHSTMDQEVRN